MSRRVFGNRGFIFAQIGLNAAPCSGNYKFCSLAKDNFAVGAQFEKSPDEIFSETIAIA